MGFTSREQARSYSEPIAERADAGTATVSGAEEPPASTKRAQLIGLLERPEGASVAEIGQRLGWLPHTVRAAISGLGKAGREVTRSKDVDDRSVYRLARIETAGAR
jgi:DNA-binding MarR family transcriptional regulator